MFEGNLVVFSSKKYQQNAERVPLIACRVDRSCLLKCLNIALKVVITFHGTLCVR